MRCVTYVVEYSKQEHLITPLLADRIRTVIYNTDVAQLTWFYLQLRGVQSKSESECFWFYLDFGCFGSI